MPFKNSNLQSYRKVGNPVQYAMVKFKLLGPIKIIAWSVICNHNCVVPKGFFVTLTFLFKFWKFCGGVYNSVP